MIEWVEEHNGFYIFSGDLNVGRGEITDEKKKVYEQHCGQAA